MLRSRRDGVVAKPAQAKATAPRGAAKAASICAAALALVLPAAGAEPERRAVAWLAQEAPRWHAENQCFSCHNNGDAARALFLAAGRGYAVPTSALEDTIGWLRDPGGWNHNRGNPAFSDQRLARIQFAAALAEACRSDYTRSRTALTIAAESLVPEQDRDGSWKIDTGGVAGAPATYGTPLATYMARRTLEIAGARRYAEPIRRANRWMATAEPPNVLDRAAILLALPASAPKHLDALLAAQTSDGGWGPQPRAPAEAFDTAVALLALDGLRQRRHTATGTIATAIGRGRAFLTKFQLADGSWPETTRPAGFTSYAERVSTAGWAAYALLVTGPKGN
jgi:hypothetical protein